MKGFSFAGRSSSFTCYPLSVGVCLAGLLVRIGVIHQFIEQHGWDGGSWYLVTSFLGILTATAVKRTGAELLVLRPRPAPGRDPCAPRTHCRAPSSC